MLRIEVEFREAGPIFCVPFHFSYQMVIGSYIERMFKNVSSLILRRVIW